MIVANDLMKSGVGFDTETNSVTIIDRQESQ
jgi:phosphopantothenoylcysteine synthetase/decarboxylase